VGGRRRALRRGVPKETVKKEKKKGLVGMNKKTREEID